MKIDVQAAKLSDSDKRWIASFAADYGYTVAGGELGLQVLLRRKEEAADRCAAATAPDLHRQD